MKVGGKKRILTGDRPTGKLHLGHFVGSLRNRVKLQHKYDTYLLIADVQALTTHWEQPELIRRSVMDVAMDNLAVGVDPEVATLCVQSMIPEIAELTVFYGLFTNMNKLRHNPTTKAEALQYGYAYVRPALFIELALDSYLSEEALAETTRLLRQFKTNSMDVRPPLATLKSWLSSRGCGVTSARAGFGTDYGGDAHLAVAWVFENADRVGPQQLENVSRGIGGALPTVDVSNQHRQMNMDYVINKLRSLFEMQHNPVLNEQVVIVKKAEDTMALQGFDQLTYGFFGYPVSQAADITVVRAHLVPVGEDQKPHIELTRDIVKKFNELYGGGREIIPLPDALVSEVPRLTALDGTMKMSKSLGNVINVSDDREEIRSTVWKAITDPQKIRKHDRGHPDICNVFKYHTIFNSEEDVVIIERDCRSGEFGCVECKGRLTEVLDAMLAPFRERRREYEEHPERVEEILREGTKKARRLGKETVAMVKEALKIDYFAI